MTDEEEQTMFEKQLKSDMAKWPSVVKAISIDMMAYIGLDDNGNLYWNGKPIEVRKTFDLKWWQVLLAIMTALGAMLSGLVAFFRLALDMCWVSL